MSSAGHRQSALFRPEYTEIEAHLDPQEKPDRQTHVLSRPPARTVLVPRSWGRPRVSRHFTQQACHLSPRCETEVCCWYATARESSSLGGWRLNSLCKLPRCLGASGWPSTVGPDLTSDEASEHKGTTRPIAMCFCPQSGNVFSSVAARQAPCWTGAASGPAPAPHADLAARLIVPVDCRLRALSSSRAMSD